MRFRNSRVALILFLVLANSCSSAHKPMTNTPATSSGVSTSLVGTDWLLTDLAGTSVIPDSKASLTFLEGGRASGNGSCNRFTGTYTVKGDSIKLGPFASTRMACMDGGVSAQEDQYLKLLAVAKRYEVKTGVLLIYVEGSDKPLQYARQTAPKP
jgi:heat shock protein HslJ